MKRLSAFAFILIFSLSPLLAQDSNLDPDFKADIVRLLKVSGGDRAVLGQAEALTDELIVPVQVVRTDISDEKSASALGRDCYLSASPRSSRKLWISSKRSWAARTASTMY